MDPAERAKWPVSAALAGPYGHPFHPILVTVPIGAWVASLIFDIASRFTAEPGALAHGSMWLIGIGILGAVAASLVGVVDLAAIPTGTPVFRMAVVHMSLAMLVTATYGVSFALRFVVAGTSQPVTGWMLGLSVAGLAVLVVVGYLGATLAFRYGVRVAAERTQAQGYQRCADAS
ncbi:DUF2231 domain-containing protein [Haloechinothrix sp. LS1_15]|uniref:DUF2231 domain-containing protein n=1 Tax=Haloechinothrix sp. LS1_15 TaxID=2652248 RepID=UPI0029458FB0|nr:DUF2231 domain-containing protein [Haloechinothrix sp. LS1_15]MDV6011244.1 DUF2231 domain-containing protein [Haloechinothrix sp. LS1_15]